MQRSFRITATFLAALLLFLAPAPALFAEAEPDSIGEAEVNPTLLLNGESVIPMDFPNIFNTYNTKDENLGQYLDRVFLLEILLNGRPLILPVRYLENKIRPFFTDIIMATLSIDYSDFKVNKNFFDKGDYIVFIHLRDIEMTLEYLDIDINDPKLYQIKEYLDSGEKMKYKDLINAFKLIIPREMQPIKLGTPKININPTIPKFTDEFLNKPVDIENLALIDIYPVNDDSIPSLVEFYETIGEPEIKDHILIEKLHEVFTKKFELDTEEIDKNFVKNKGYNKNKYDYRDNHGLGGILWFIGSRYPAMIDPFLEVKTYGDLLEVYQMFPLEVQRQYKESDFKDHPNIDPSWWAERPYAELSVGSRGQEVLDMKARFLELGYFRTDKYNDQFSKNTADTVKLFEKNNGLPVDGVADAVMLGVLFSDSAAGK